MGTTENFKNRAKLANMEELLAGKASHLGDLPLIQDYKDLKEGSGNRKGLKAVAKEIDSI